jgi:outer membrane protein assembly factor BamB
VNPLNTDSVDHYVSRVTSLFRRIRSLRSESNARSRGIRIGIVVPLLALVLVASGCANIANPDGWSSPVLSGDSLVTQTSDGVISLFELSDTTTLLNPTGWRWQYPAGTDDVDLKTVYATPLIDGTVVYIAGHSGDVVALNLANGRPIDTWPAPIALDEPIVATPALNDGVLYIITDHGNLYRLDAKTGSRLAAPTAIGGRHWAKPVVSGDRVYVAGIDESFSALTRSDGSTQWSADIGSTAGDPVPDGNVLLVPSFDRRIHALDLSANGAERWTSGGEGDGWFWGSPVIAGETVYAVTVNGSAYAFDRESGAQQWSSRAGDSDEVRAAPILVGGILIFATRDGDVRGLDATTGIQRWEQHVDGRRFYADPLMLDSNALLADDKGGLWLIDPASGTIRPFLERS